MIGDCQRERLIALDRRVVDRRDGHCRRRLTRRNQHAAAECGVIAAARRRSADRVVHDQIGTRIARSSDREDRWILSCFSGVRVSGGNRHRRQLRRRGFRENIRTEEAQQLRVRSTGDEIDSG